MPVANQTPVTVKFWLDKVPACHCCLARTKGVTNCYLQYRLANSQQCPNIRSLADMKKSCTGCSHQTMAHQCPVSAYPGAAISARRLLLVL